MLDFKPFSIEELKKAHKYIKTSKLRCSDISLGSLFMWHEDNEVSFCEWKDTFVIKQMIGEQPAFSWPIGSEPDGMIDKLIEYTTNMGLALRFFAIDEETLEIIRNDKRLNPFMCAYDLRWSDYIYDYEEMMNFKGKKFDAQRNHINKFKRLYGEPCVKFLTNEDQSDIYKMLDEYDLEHPVKNNIERIEYEQTRKLMAVYEELGLFGAGLYVGDKLVAVSVGEKVDDMLVIHVEKALKVYEGAYPTMFSGFVRLVKNYLGCELCTVNREDDSGDIGLRTSKMRYKPIGKVHKYLVHINSPALKLTSGVLIKAEGLIITEIREEDKAAYLALNTDVMNNMYWGYDYRDDFRISDEIDGDTFYDSMKFDMNAGDSINLAIRLKEDGRMIGEAILWNFTNGFAELGCRIMPEYHGKGYGKAAFGAVCSYGEQALGLKINARCYHLNKASYFMIMANGFIPVRKDETFCYFERDKEICSKKDMNKCINR